MSSGDYMLDDCEDNGPLMHVGFELSIRRRYYICNEAVLLGERSDAE